MKSRQPFRDGKIHVMSEQCSTCIFRRGNLMHLSRGRAGSDATLNEAILKALIQKLERKEVKS